MDCFSFGILARCKVHQDSTSMHFAEKFLISLSVQFQYVNFGVSEVDAFGISSSL